MILVVRLGAEPSAVTGDSPPGPVNSSSVALWAWVLSGREASRRTFLPELKSCAFVAFVSGFVNILFHECSHLRSFACPEGHLQLALLALGESGIFPGKDRENLG